LVEARFVRFAHPASQSASELQAAEPIRLHRPVLAVGRPGGSGVDRGDGDHPQSGHWGTVTTYSRHLKPALGPLGDSLEDLK
jgi:hypothetical protein